MVSWLRLSALTAALTIAPAAPVAAQLSLADGVSARLSGRVHTQFNTSSVSTVGSTEFLIRRARLTLDVRISPRIAGKVEPDFGEGKIALKDAYFRITVGPEFHATFGQFKRPFDLFELTSSTRLLTVERTGRIRGVDTCTGPGGLCSYSQFTEKLDYADRDIGVMVHGSLADDRFSYAASATNGTGANTADENGNKSFSGRVAVEVVPDVSVGANVGVHDYVHPTSGANRYGTALGADVEIGSFGPGLHVQTGIVTGDNWQNPVGVQDAATFLTAQAIVSYRARVTGELVTGVEPVGRVSWGDPDTDTDGDHGLLLTPGLMLHLGNRNYLSLNVDVWSPSQGDTEFSFKGQSFFYF